MASSFLQSFLQNTLLYENVAKDYFNSNLQKTVIEEVVSCTNEIILVNELSLEERARVYASRYVHKLDNYSLKHFIVLK
jgi:hypothetical protein